MDAKQLADKFSAKVAAAAVERERQQIVSDENRVSRADDAEYCKRAMRDNVLPFLQEFKGHLADQFSYAPQIDLHDHQVVGVSFKIGDGPTTNILTAFGNVMITHSGASGSSQGVSFVYNPEAEPYIWNSGDLTRDKIAKLIEMVIDNAE